MDKRNRWIVVGVSLVFLLYLVISTQVIQITSMRLRNKINFAARQTNGNTIRLQASPGKVKRCTVTAPKKAPKGWSNSSRYFGSRKPCTWEVFKDHYSTENYFPEGGGHWEFKAWGYKKDQYIPDLCQISIKSLHPTKLRQCVQEKGWRKFVTMGDSNGVRYFLAILGWMKSIATKCRLVKEEDRGDNYMPNPKYFMKNRKDLQDLFVIKPRFCHSCSCRYHVCQVGKGEIAIEHLATTAVIDRSLYTINVSLRMSGNNEAPDSIPVTHNAQEFMLKFYLKNNMPDVLILALPFIHEYKTPLQQVYSDLQLLIDLVGKHVPHSTIVIWVTNMKVWKFQGKKFEGLTADDKVAMLNQRLFRLLKEKISEPGSNWFGFFDLQSVFCPLRNFTKDGVHFKPEIYQVIMGHLLQLMCHL